MLFEDFKIFLIWRFQNVQLKKISKFVAFTCQIIWIYRFQRIYMLLPKLRIFIDFYNPCQCSACRLGQCSFWEVRANNKYIWCYTLYTNITLIYKCDEFKYISLYKYITLIIIYSIIDHLYYYIILLMYLYHMMYLYIFIS